jgi:hypothetical protein
LYKLQQRELVEKMLEKRAAASGQLASATSFEQQLKRQLGQ